MARSRCNAERQYPLICLNLLLKLPLDVFGDLFRQREALSCMCLRCSQGFATIISLNPILTGPSYGHDAQTMQVSAVSLHTRPGIQILL